MFIVFFMFYFFWVLFFVGVFDKMFGDEYYVIELIFFIVLKEDEIILNEENFCLEYG